MTIEELIENFKFLGDWEERFAYLIELGKKLPPLDASDLTRASALFRGVIEQTPPVYSAIRVGGQRAYERARRGESVSMPTRQVRIDALGVTVLESNRLRLQVRCGSGTYIRTLAADLAQALGTVGHLVALRRTAVGPLTVCHAAAPDGLTEEAVWSTARLLGHLGERLDLDAVACRWVRDGKPLDKLPPLMGQTDGRYGVFNDGDPVALLECRGGQWAILRGLPKRP